MRLIMLSLLLLISLTGCQVDNAKENPCAGQQWQQPSDMLDCYYPDPPAGRWKAVYTQAFAKQYNLPPENISTDLSPGIDYLEMDVQPHPNGDPKKNHNICLVNMLVKKPHDFAFYNYSDTYFTWEATLHKNRKLTRFVDIDQHKHQLKTITTFHRAAGELNDRIKFSRGGPKPFAFYAEDVLEGYDYVTADGGCYTIITNKNLYPDKYGLSVKKASFWGKYEPRYKSRSIGPFKDANDPRYMNSKVLIKIPESIITEIYKDMPIGGYE